MRAGSGQPGRCPRSSASVGRPTPKPVRAPTTPHTWTALMAVRQRLPEDTLGRGVLCCWVGLCISQCPHWMPGALPALAVTTRKVCRCCHVSPGRRNQLPWEPRAKAALPVCTEGPGNAFTHVTEHFSWVRGVIQKPPYSADPRLCPRLPPSQEQRVGGGGAAGWCGRRGAGPAHRTGPLPPTLHTHACTHMNTHAQDTDKGLEA